ncbi:hypothetical protein [Frigoribacterium sp. UYMn621]|uniref:hypothetical protein n=1 Tax=Frigoribacterium sp. UYMn621 TaxID=3156343 RepID=UPI003395DB3F
MSLVDRTNEQISLSMHEPSTWEAPTPGLMARGADWDAGTSPAELDVDADSESGRTPSAWINISWSDIDHDSDTVQLTYEEAGLLHDRLGLILGRSGTEANA